ncbi:MAG: hypothetical protein ABIZ80_21670 [Bryobacteraceae bacterium]
MNIQETVDRLAVLARPRLATLLRLKAVRHIYDATPGAINSKVTEDGQEVTLNRVKRTSQPYRQIERFVTEERVMQYIVDPGLLPIVTALSKDILGRQVLGTRKVAAKNGDQGVVAHIDGYGVRIMMYFDGEADDTIIVWDCLYGVV